mgnify:CR=1 FL=1
MKKYLYRLLPLLLIAAVGLLLFLRKEQHPQEPFRRTFPVMGTIAQLTFYAPQEKAVMWVHPGESLWEISQRECIQISTIYKLNGFEPSLRVFKTRQQIYLAKVKE